MPQIIEALSLPIIVLLVVNHLQSTTGHKYLNSFIKSSYMDKFQLFVDNFSGYFF